MTRIILDTNAYILYSKKNIEVIKVILKSNEVCISVISCGELTAGFLKGSMFEYNNAKLNSFINNSKIKLLEVNKNTSEIYGKIYKRLKQEGGMIPINDVWIAASAIETNSNLVTYDKHFLKIPNLKLWSGINDSP